VVKRYRFLTPCYGSRTAEEQVNKAAEKGWSLHSTTVFPKPIGEQWCSIVEIEWDGIAPLIEPE
jgi:hypothetical protein